ncbi:MAG: MBL fold metallo-hydrolase, partial [Proteobacteria bacterium]|nr:MBL fold metallo-hydrolase [Pseudomonadota bacterium]
LFEQLVLDPPGNVDVLLMEGTTVGRTDTKTGFPTETDLENRFVEIFRATKGMPLVWCSGQNIDRLVTVFRACKKSGRQFIVDMYTAHILRATGNDHIPQAHWKEIRVFLPYFQRKRVKRLGVFNVSNSYKKWRIYREELAEAAPRSVMLFRPSMTVDVDRAECLEGAHLVYSMWGGYLANDEMQPFLTWLDRKGIPMSRVHTSGHASVKDLKRLADSISARTVIPIHSALPEQFENFFVNVELRADGQTFEV